MSNRDKFETLAQELDQLLRQPHRPDGLLDRRIRELREALRALNDVERSGALRERLEELEGHIADFERRRDAARHAHDIAPGQDALTPMLGWDFRRTNRTEP